MSLNEIKSLVASVSAAKPHDHQKQVDLLDRINSLKSLMKRGEQQDLVAYLDAASVLTEVLASTGELTPERVSGMVSKLLNRVEKTYDSGQFREISSGSGALGDGEANDSDGESRLSLELKKDQCLGEIMIQIGSLSEEDLAEGLKAQRAAGIRIGEALVMLGKVSWEEVERAVQLQEKLRSTFAEAEGLSLEG